MKAAVFVGVLVALIATGLTAFPPSFSVTVAVLITAVWLTVDYFPRRERAS